MSVVEAFDREVETLGGDVGDSTLAATARALAVELDGHNSATSKSMCAKALADVMRELRALAPPKKEQDDLSDLRQRREQRRSGSTAPADSARP